ncbi:acetyl-CoA acetyltransferase [Nocardioides zeae]|uniref:Acetyl-CoA acetyltransferase n=1 Tax=Nocardioides zeae TaxID=1457234 RepID=A0ACC6IJ52_9ACTN|nr:lipid-transfer protein [Nocardioides zeae]MDR6174662.1 acetyl-CoA acetyltransferase [Nocardioides zeae]MDR6210731.1 acetyl-CoA acetyltransferase [Nocardioides zeae]
MRDAWRPDTMAVVGIGSTDFSKASGRSTLTLATQASLAALADAGLDPKDVDGIVRCDMDTVAPVALGEALGVENLTYWGDVGPGGSAPAAMVAQAAAAVAAGLASTVVVFRSINGRSGERYGAGYAQSTRAGGSSTYEEMFLPYGMQTPGQYFAMVARRHMADHGTTSETLGRIATACRKHANANPAAQMHHRTMTMDDYHASRPLATPLRLFDFCLETDGACAVVVTSAERARDLRQPPALIRSAAQSGGADAQPGQMFPALMRDSITTWSSRALGEVLFRRGDMTPQDVDVAQIYDCFTITALIQLEDLGFCGAGEAKDFIQEGTLEVGGALPINTSGGHLSEGYIHGMNHVVEAVRQIRGTSTNQVPGAEVSLVTSAPTTGGSALLLVGA